MQQSICNKPLKIHKKWFKSKGLIAKKHLDHSGFPCARISINLNLTNRIKEYLSSEKLKITNISVI